MDIRHLGHARAPLHHYLAVVAKGTFSSDISGTVVWTLGNVLRFPSSEQMAPPANLT